jgi:hypothetical protein
MFAYGSAVVTCLALLVGAASAAAKSPPLCHTKAPQTVAPNSWAPSQTQLAPPGAGAIRLCRYTPLSAHQKIARATLLRRQVWVAKLIREFNVLSPPPSGTVACPADLGLMIVALLAYPDGHTVTILMDASGCTTVTNGNLIRTIAVPPPLFGPKLLTELEHLTGLRP